MDGRKKASDVCESSSETYSNTDESFEIPLCGLICTDKRCVHSLDSLGNQWEWGASVSGEDRSSPATGRRPKARPSSQWTQVHGHLPETTNLLLTLQRFYLVGNTHTHTHNTSDMTVKFPWTNPGLNADSSVCDLIGACWGSRDTSVRVSTFLWWIPISQVTLHIIYYLSTRTQEGLHVAEWQLWFGHKPPLPRATDELHYTNTHIRNYHERSFSCTCVPFSFILKIMLEIIIRLLHWPVEVCSELQSKWMILQNTAHSAVQCSPAQMLSADTGSCGAYVGWEEVRVWWMGV